MRYGILIGRYNGKILVRYNGEIYITGYQSANIGNEIIFDLYNSKKVAIIK